MTLFSKLVRDRYSCRQYDHREVPKELLVSVLECARMAPSAVNFQPVRFVVVSKDPLKSQLAECYAGSWLSSAPIIIVACGNYSEAWRRADGKSHCDIDVAIAVDHLTLAAAEVGLGTSWVCKFDAFRCASILKLPKHVSPIALVPIGYPLEKDNYSKLHLERKSLEELVSWEGYHF